MPSLLARSFMPPRFRRIYRRYRDRRFALLDVGCGNHSPSHTRRFFPHVRYHGIDMIDYNIDERDADCIDELYRLDLDRDSLDGIPNEAFDVVIAAHILEHLHDPAAVVRQLCRKLKPGGSIYCEFPSLVSLGLPSMRGSLQFCDDDTHVHLPNPYDLANAMLAGGVAVLDGKLRRDMPRYLMTPLFVAGNWARRIVGRAPRSRGLWDARGFAFYLYGEKRHGS